MLVRYHVILEGQVQGVGCRSFCIMNAAKYHCTGTVKNLYNGMVEIFVQGEEKNVDLFLKAVRTGNRFMRVDDMSLKAKPIVEGERGFGYA